MIKQFINFNVQYIVCECKQSYEVDPEEKLKKFYCMTCKKNKCIRCKKDVHKGSCGFTDLLNMLMPSNWPIDEKGKKMKLRMCPYCGDVVNKDESCEHVTCYKCKKDFNFCCGSKRSPSLIHGIHYHRECCFLYQN
mmetsp:Transcript_1853/g.1770  ORF Transcript_1853/g.1770 Transcript_1853/m.1770 type:complete len:136 (-) Transcript_1853:265-672(-)